MNVVRELEYQEAASGWLPMNWQLRPLRDTGEILSGGTPATAVPEYWNGGIPWCTPTDITRLNGRRVIRTTEKNISPVGLKNSGAAIIRENSVLVCTRATVGVCAINAERITTNQGFKAIVPNENFSSDYLYFAITNLQPELKKKASGSTFLEINKTEFEKILIVQPPLPEQKKIAAILKVVDDKLDIIRRQIEATQTLKQGLMQTLFSRGVGTQDDKGSWVPHTEFKESELGEVPADWTVAPLGELIQKLMDFRGRTPKKLGMDWGGGVIPALSANNVRMGYIDFDRECYLGSDELYAAWMVQGDTQKNDLVFTMEAPLGNVAVIPDDRKYILSQRVVLLRVNRRVKHGYLFQYLRSDTFRKILEANSTGTTAKGIQQKRLVQLPVVVPSQDEQERIADMLGAIDSKLDALLSKQSYHQTFKRGLMQKLLTGEWRVNVDANTTRA